MTAADDRAERRRRAAAERQALRRHRERHGLRPVRIALPTDAAALFVIALGLLTPDQAIDDRAVDAAVEKWATAQILSRRDFPPTRS